MIFPHLRLALIHFLGGAEHPFVHGVGIREFKRSRALDGAGARHADDPEIDRPGCAADFIRLLHMRPGQLELLRRLFLDRPAQKADSRTGK